MTQKKIEEGLHAVDAVRKSSVRLSETLDNLEALLKTAKGIVDELDAAVRQDKSNADRMTKLASEIEKFHDLPNTLAAAVEKSIESRMDEVVKQVTERLERHHRDEIARLEKKILQEMPRTIFGRRGRE